MSDTQSDTQVDRARSGAGFFHIDKRTWKLLCGRDDMNQAVAYLVIAAGTGAGNRISRWSAQSVETYTGLHSSRAKLAITSLISAGYLRRTDQPAASRTRTPPTYELQPFGVVHQVALKALQDSDRFLIQRAISPRCRLKDFDRFDVARLVLHGVLRQTGKIISLCPDATEANSSLIWLPNTLVTGTKAHEASPVRRLRSSGDLWAFRLLVDLYWAQNLSADSGISRFALRSVYTRKRCGDRGRHVIWGFTKKESTADGSHDAIAAFWEAANLTGRYLTEKNKVWDAICALESMGLLTCIPHLVENLKPDCEPIHGFGRDGVGEAIEQELAVAADEGARYVIGQSELDLVDDVDFLVPAWDTQPDVQMVGIYRLTYRPQTELTADWMRRLGEAATVLLETYGKLGPQNY